MSDIVVLDKPEVKKTSRFLAILLLVTMFVPHSVVISHLSYPDNSYIRYTVSAFLWAISHQSGSTITGPYSYMFVEFLATPTLLLGALLLPLYIIVVISQWRFIKGTTTKKSILRVIGLTLIIQVFLQLVFFGYQLDGWASLQIYPLPIFHILNALAVIRLRDSESIEESSLRDTVGNSIITSFFWCVSLVFFTVGFLVLSNFFIAGPFQPAFTLSQLLTGFGFLTLAVILILVRVRSETSK